MLTERIAGWGEVDFSAPATPDDLSVCESLLGYRLPEDLRLVLAAANGITDETGTDVLWNSSRIAESNAFFRTSPEFIQLYMPFESLVFFADAGDGDQFGVSTRGNLEIYRWDHENDSRVWVASTVLDFLERFLTGALDDEDP